MNRNTASTPFRNPRERRDVSTPFLPPQNTGTVPSSSPQPTTNLYPTGPLHTGFASPLQPATIGTASPRTTDISPLLNPSTAHPSPPIPATPVSLHDAQVALWDAAPNNSNISPSSWIEENPLPCDWCVSYIASYPAGAQGELDGTLGQGIVCARLRNGNSTSNGSTSKCLRCRPHDNRQCGRIPPGTEDLVVEVVNAYKQYVANRDPDNLEREWEWKAWKLHLLTIDSLHHDLTAIGALPSTGIPECPLSPDETRKIKDEIRYEVDLSRHNQAVAASRNRIANAGISAIDGSSSPGQRNLTAPVQQTADWHLQPPHGFQR